MTQKYRAIQKNEICKVFETGKQRNVLTQYFQSKIVWPNIEEFILRTIQYKKPFFCTFPLFCACDICLKYHNRTFVHAHNKSNVISIDKNNWIPCNNMVIAAKTRTKEG